ncbi:conjugative transposon protein TraM [Mucilaginibacter sp. UYCu711]|uniref:conjugative transposon protein TraM n=1 Tax=Mucilaginibacter sp. UYCu711 TaxID=3156339 RepID=UPI003D213549
MKTTELTSKQKRQRIALLVLPLIIFCCTTLLFWALGGGQPESAKAAAKKGLRMKLPASIIGAEQTGDKMSFYDKAQADSLKKDQLRKTDPYTKAVIDSTANRLSFGDPYSPQPVPAFETSATNHSAAANEARINQRLSQLQAVINAPPVALKPAVRESVLPKVDSVVKVKSATEDPELKQMNGLLEKILEIQHPERAKAANTADEKGAVKKFRAIPAEIVGNQKIVQGTVIKMQLLDTVTIGGQFYEKGQLIYGSGTLTSQRYTLNIRSIHVGYNFFPVDLTVFDMHDGLEGISVPEAVTGDVLRDGAVGGVQNMDMMSFDPSMTAQLTTAGINTAKGLFSKKIKQVKGKLKDKHQLLLRDNNSLKPGNY